MGLPHREGVSERDLEGLTRRPCAPDVVGLNYYVTSDRYLDHEVDHYREAERGGNGRDDLRGHRGRSRPNRRGSGVTPPFSSRLGAAMASRWR